MSKKNLLKRIVYILVVDIMAIQILLGFIWMGRNILAIPLFGDSTEYLNLSQTFMLDEYRPVMYPLILRIITEICERIPIPYQVIVYIMQTIISFLSIWFTVYTVDKIMFNHSMSKNTQEYSVLYHCIL